MAGVGTPLRPHRYGAYSDMPSGWKGATDSSLLFISWSGAKMQWAVMIPFDGCS
jgi:hypothetical protein